MRCDLHCPPAVSVLRGPLLAAGALAVLSLGVYVADAVASFLAAVTVAIFAVNAIMAAVAYRLVRYGALRKPARVQSAGKVQSGLPVVTARTRSITAPPLAIEAPAPVLDGAVVAEGETIGR